MHKRFFSLLFSVMTATAWAQHPAWTAQSNVYEVNLRQYSESGSIKDFQQHLPRLKAMGVHILWFMPITPIGIEGRKMTSADLGSYYAVRDYKAVNPEFGSMADWKALVKKAHAMGFKVVTDWVANHSAQDNPWAKQHPEFYVHDSTGKIVSPFDWTDVYKLNYQNNALRDSMIDAMQFWVTQTGIDGFRCDVAEEVPTDFWKRAISSLRKIKPLYFLAEGDKPELHEAGFDETYTWSLMGIMSDIYKGTKTLTQFDSALNANIRRYPKNAYRMFFTTNHDENSWNGTEFEKYGDAHKAFAVFTQTMYQSVPLIYSGQEEPNTKRLKFFVKDPIEWKKYSYAPFYKTLLNLRKSTPALAADAAYTRLNSSKNEAIFSYLRTKAGKKVLVVLNLSAQAQQFQIPDQRITGNPLNVFLKTKEKLHAKHTFSMEPWGYIVYDYSK
jgi:glycosidase